MRIFLLLFVLTSCKTLIHFILVTILEYILMWPIYYHCDHNQIKKFKYLFKEMSVAYFRF